MEKFVENKGQPELTEIYQKIMWNLRMKKHNIDLDPHLKERAIFLFENCVKSSIELGNYDAIYNKLQLDLTIISHGIKGNVDLSVNTILDWYKSNNSNLKYLFEAIANYKKEERNVLYLSQELAIIENINIIVNNIKEVYINE